MRRLRLWKVFAFGLAVGLLMAVIQRASEEYRFIRMLLFE